MMPRDRDGVGDDNGMRKPGAQKDSSRRTPSPLARVLLSLLPAVLGFGFAEAGARVWYFWKNGRNMKYLIAPFGPGVRQPPLEYRYRLNETFASFDRCSGRDITYTANTLGGRGPVGPTWRLPKPPGTIRIMAVGGSTTWGMSNPDWATWPVLLQAKLTERYAGTTIEVLNAGLPKRRLESIVRELPQDVSRYAPDLVIYYGAFNNAIARFSAYDDVEVTLDRFHKEHWLGRIADWCYGRSMLYTFLVEKPLFSLAARKTDLVPEISYFRDQLHRFIQISQHRGVRPVFVLQVTAIRSAPGFESLSLDDVSAVQRFLVNALGDDAMTSYGPRQWLGAGGMVNLDVRQPWSRRWALQAQVLMETVRRTGEASGVQVIDPRPAFSRYDGDEPIFCDVVHLTDQGNELLSQSISDELDLSTLVRQ